MIPNLPNPHDQFTKDDITNGFSKLLVIENALSEDLCDEIIAYGEENAKPASNKHNHNFLINVSTCWLPLNHKVHEALQPIWQQAIDFYQFDISFIEPYELKKYNTGGYYSRHIDNYHGMNIPVDRKLSISLQLNGEEHYEGGDLKLMYKAASKKKGAITFFPSFYPHGVEKVTKGTRWVMIGWAWGPYWR